MKKKVNEELLKVDSAEPGAGKKELRRVLYAGSTRQPFRNSILYEGSVPGEAVDESGVVKYSGNGFEIVEFYEDDNKFPLLLSQAAELSPTKVSCVHNKVNYVLGDGFVVERGDVGGGIFGRLNYEEELMDVSREEERSVVEWGKKKNVNGRNLLGFVKEVLVDWFTFGNVYVYLKKYSVIGS